MDTLINCVVENVGFSEGRPVAAITIYKCLLHWRVFETDKTNVFDRLIQIFGSAMQVFLSSIPSLNALFAFYLSQYTYIPRVYEFLRNKITMLISHTGCQIHHLY